MIQKFHLLGYRQEGSENRVAEEILLSRSQGYLSIIVLTKEKCSDISFVF